MTDVLQLPFFQSAAIAALVLAGIHAYLGFHIVRRGVLFVDLALAQMAALGVAMGVVLGREHDEVGSYLLALGMTFVGAALFAWLRGRSKQVPLEAFIGIVFATAQAAVFLVLEKSPAGPEHLKETLVGSLFTVDPGHIARVAVLYAVVGAVHFFLRKPFFEITNDPEGARARAFGVVRDLEERLPQEEVHRAHHGVQHRDPGDVARVDGEQRAHQRFLQVLGAGGRLLEHQEHRGLRGREHDADERFERHLLRPPPKPREQCRPHERHAERQQVGADLVVFAAQHHSHRHTERRHLRERKVHEQHAAPHDVETQVRVDARQHQCCDRRGLEERELQHVRHFRPPAIDSRTAAKCAR